MSESFSKATPYELRFLLNENALQEEHFQEVYLYVDAVQISKQKKNLNRDFSDCSLMAEVIKHYLPNSHKILIDVHNYAPTN